MHIPENYLSPQTCAVMAGAMLPIWYKSVHKVEEQVKLHKETIPMLGISSSLAFLIMMFNLPVPGGTTAHAVGAVLLAILMGPWSACLSVSIALLLQAFLFGDGGILAFGANCFSMAFLMPFTGYGIYQLFARKHKKIGAFLGGYVGINAAALVTAVVLGLQPLLFTDSKGLPLYNPYPLAITIPAMMSTHLLVVGVVEGLFTVGVSQFVFRLTPENRLQGKNTHLAKHRPLYWLLAGLILLTPLGLLAQGTAWGEWDLSALQQVLKSYHLPQSLPKGMTRGPVFHAFFSDYQVPGLPTIAGYLLSAATAVIVFILFYRLLFERRRN